MKFPHVIKPTEFSEATKALIQSVETRIFWGIVAFLLVFGPLATVVADPITDFYGVRSSFLVGDPGDRKSWRKRWGNTLVYLAPEFGNAAQRKVFRDRLKKNGDTHIDVYAQARHGNLGGGQVWPERQDFTARLKELNDDGLKPVLWLIPESKHGDHKQSMDAHFAFQNQMVAKHDIQVAGYVVCLECDETFSPEQVNQLVANLKAKTGKPVAVHLAPGVGGFKRDIRYYKGADFIYLQIGDHLHGDFVADSTLAVNMLKEAMKLGIPVVANEYSAVSESATARALGDLLCANGAVGTGNGRNVEPCGQAPKEREKWYHRYEKEIVVAGVAMATLYAVTRYDLPLTLKATEDSYEIGTKKRIGNHSVGASYSENRAMATYEFRF